MSTTNAINHFRFRVTDCFGLVDECDFFPAIDDTYCTVEYPALEIVPYSFGPQPRA